MVQGEPYIHFTINNEPLEQTIDYNYTWATTIESEKGPVNQPTLVSTASQAQAIFGVDMRPYFAQGANALIIVRVVGEDLKKASKGVYSFNTNEDIPIYRAERATLEIYDFTSYAGAEANAQQYATGSVKITGVVDVKDNKEYTQVEVIANTESSFIGQKFFIISSAKLSNTRYELFDSTNDTIGASANIFVTINEQYSHKLYYAILDTNGEKQYVPLIEYRDAKGVLMPEQYIDSWQPNGRCITDDEGNVLSKVYHANEVKPFLTPVRRTIEAGSPLFTVTSKYEGDYGITISTSKSLNINESTNDDGYTIVLTDPALGTIRINNGYDVSKIVNRINDKGFNFEARITNYGLAITEAMHSNTEYIATKNIADYPTLIIPNAKSASIPENTFITLAEVKKLEETDPTVITYLTESDALMIENDLKTGGNQANVKAIDYSINLATAGNQSLVGGSNGEWDSNKKRIPAKGTLQFDAHKKGLDLLRRLRIAGVFCMYGEVDIQRAYVEHGIDSIEPEKGMNNNLTCKWRTIILGADKTDRDSKTSLAARAAALSDQYTLLLGQGLIDTGYYGEAFNMSVAEKHHYGIVDNHQLLPYECTQYIAGLRSKLNYDESIFGGQGRKRIRSIGDLQIAPLFDYEEKYDWDPKTYTYLNESGVLTFTEDYGQITLTDGVTTIQTGFEEDEEGVMNILKYAQNGIYDICLPYIGRNINGDLEQSITMEIQSFLEGMKVNDQSIIDTDEFSAYELDVSLGSRNTQLLGRIYIYLKITPVHALRQIEVEMTVQ